MRLVCQNCDAEYEVDDTAIPPGGRDVQCSNCGHGWFQTHPEVEAEQEAEAALYEAPVAAHGAAVVAPAAGPQPKPVKVPAKAPAKAAAAVAPPFAATPQPDPEPAAPLTPEAAVAATLSAAAVAEPDPMPAPAATPPAMPSRGLDESVLAVLREEAARETAARKSEAAPGIETQVEMGLEATDNGTASGGQAAAAIRRITRLQGGAEPETAAPVARTRRDLLPAIEEINSTLRATSDRHSDDDNAVVASMAAPKATRSGFGRGFLLLVLLALIIVALYLAAPLIEARVPALAGAAQAYVAAVDAARVWLDTEIKALITTLRGYDRSQAG